MSSIQGTGTQIVFNFAAPYQSLSFVGRYRQIGGLNRSRPVLDDTALSSTVYMEKVAGDLMDMGPIPCEIFANPDVEIPNGKTATITITFPAQTGQTNGATLTFSGFINEDDGGVSEANVLKMATFSIQPDGKTTKPVIAPGS
jgi:hypothetical protein